MQPTVTSPPSKKKGKYDITFKLKVIQWAEKHSNRAAGSKFGLNESTIRGWRKSAVANSLEALSEISRGVISIHSVQQPQQQQHQPTPAITKSAPKQIQTSESKLSANQNIQHLNNNNIITNGAGNGNNHSSNGVGGGGGNNNHHRNSHGSHPYHNHHMNHHHLSNRHSILKGGSRPSSRPVSPPETLSLDERDLARLSCSPSDDSHYDEGSYQEEVVESPPPSPPLVSQPQHHSYQQQQQQSANNQQQQYQMQQLHTQQAHQHLHVPQQHQQSHSQQSSQVLKTISHQVTSRPYPELQIPFTVIVCKSVRDHWLQRYAVEKPESDSEIDAFARVLGLERR